MNEKATPDKICRVGGKEFLIYREYDDICDKKILIYPDFDENPEFTDEGQPFTLAVRENCEYFIAKIKEDEIYKDCGVCKYFSGDGLPYHVIGICMCDTLKQHVNKNKEETKT